jgi:tetratricopeptide (TPR) repeat protein
VAQDLVDRGLAYQAHASGDLREAIRCYERAIGLDPSLAKPHYQLVAALAALGQAHDAASIYERRLAKAPDDVVAHRCLAQAQVAAGLWDDAARTIERGLALAPDDAFLLEQEGGLLAGTGCNEEALHVLERALDADSSSIGRYSRAFLLERLGRPAEAAAEWEAILEWCRERGYDDDMAWPAQELARLRSEPGP